RPGLAAATFWTVFTLPAAATKGHHAVSHVEQMYASQCFRASNRRGAERALGCTSCHNPHEAVAPADRLAFYRRQCLQCHATKPCSLDVAVRQQQSKGDSCIDCHMP